MNDQVAAQTIEPQVEPQAQPELPNVIPVTIGLDLLGALIAMATPRSQDQQIMVLVAQNAALIAKLQHAEAFIGEMQDEQQDEEFPEEPMAIVKPAPRRKRKT